MDHDYEIDYDENCPKCNHTPIHYRRCNQIGCDDGFIDMHQYDDPLWYDPGEYEICDECNGTSVEKWCPGCGANLSGHPPPNNPNEGELLQPVLSGLEAPE